MTIQQIKEDLVAFELVQCGLKHELVKLDLKTKVPLKLIGSHENEYQRISLCQMVDRKKRLGCAHSSSNTNFNRLIDQLKTENPEIKVLQKKINNQILEIYKLDHKKGDLEKEFAICLDKQITTRNIKQQLKECIAVHRTYIDNLKGLKKSLINSIDRLLLNSNIT